MGQAVRWDPCSHGMRTTGLMEEEAVVAEADRMRRIRSWIMGMLIVDLGCLRSRTVLVEAMGLCRAAEVERGKSRGRMEEGTDGVTASNHSILGREREGDGGRKVETAVVWHLNIHGLMVVMPGQLEATAAV